MGTKVSQEEHLLLLEKMKQLKQRKNVLVMQKATAEEVIKELETYDEVVVALKNDSILRIRPNVVYINGILAFSINPTSDEPGKTYEQGIHKSNNYTGQQRFKQILQKYLD